MFPFLTGKQNRLWTLNQSHWILSLPPSLSLSVSFEGAQVVRGRAEGRSSRQGGGRWAVAKASWSVSGPAGKGGMWKAKNWHAPPNPFPPWLCGISEMLAGWGSEDQVEPVLEHVCSRQNVPRIQPGMDTPHPMAESEVESQCWIILWKPDPIRRPLGILLTQVWDVNWYVCILLWLL